MDIHKIDLNFDTSAIISNSILNVSENIIGRKIVSSGMLCRVALVRADVFG
jgi:hypothetical protein